MTKKLVTNGKKPVAILPDVVAQFQLLNLAGGLGPRGSPAGGGWNGRKFVGNRGKLRGGYFVGSLA